MDLNMKEVYRFLKELKANNNREWFNNNKDQYLKVKETINVFTEQLILALTKIDPSAAGLTPADCTYRIYRDTRFSKNKTPYKTHIGIVLCPGGTKKSYRACYYIHLEPDNSFIAGGCWCPPAPLLKEIRQSIFDNIEEYLEIINNPDFKKHYSQVGDDLLKTYPKGFPKDWEYIDLLRPREYTIFGEVPDSLMIGNNNIKKIQEYMVAQKPYDDFLNYIFEEHPELAIPQRENRK